MGLIQIAAGALKLGKFIRIVPFKVTEAGVSRWLEGETLWLMPVLAAIGLIERRLP